MTRFGMRIEWRWLRRCPGVRAAEIDPPGEDAVDQAAAVFGVQLDGFGFCDIDRRRVGRLLRERMPDLQAGVHS
jgi:hypothetical protein